MNTEKSSSSSNEKASEKTEASGEKISIYRPDEFYVPPGTEKKGRVWLKGVGYVPK